MKKSSMRASLRAQVKLVSLKLLRAPYISDYLQVRSVLENVEEPRKNSTLQRNIKIKMIFQWLATPQF